MPPRFILPLLASLVAVHGASAAGNPKNAPEPQSPPTIAGTAQEGMSLTASDGTWSGSGAQLQFAYQWRRCSSETICTNVTGATTKTYALSAADVTYRLRVVVTATNKFGNGSSASVLTAVVGPRPALGGGGGGGGEEPTPPSGSAPANTSAPSISGTTVVGSGLTAAPGSWSGSIPITYSYQWRRCDSAGANCADIAGATSTSFALTSTDAGKTLRVRAIAQNTYGSSSATSAATSVIVSTSTAPPPPSGTIGFTGDWETGNVSQWDWGAQCANTGVPSTSSFVRGNLSVVTNPISQGSYAGRFDLPAASVGNACEAIRQRRLSLESDDYYGLDVRFPTDWQEPSPHGWGMVIAQLNFQGIWGMPVGLYAHRDHVKLALQSGYCRSVSSGNPGCTYSSATGGNLPLTYAIPASRFSTGTWHQLVIHVRWTESNAGLVEVWHRPRGSTTWVKTVHQSGYPTVQWADNKPAGVDQTTADKIGAYRGPASFPTSISHDAFVIGTSFDTVAQRLDAQNATAAPEQEAAPTPAPAAAPAPAAPAAPDPELATAPAPTPAPTSVAAPPATSPSQPSPPATSPDASPAQNGTQAGVAETARVTRTRAATRVVFRFKRGFAGRVVGTRHLSSADGRGRPTVTVYHLAPWGKRVFSVERVRADGSFRVDKLPWSRRRTLTFRAVVTSPGAEPVSSGLLVLRRAGKAPTAFQQRRTPRR